MKTLNTQMEETHQSSIRINTNKTAQAARDQGLGAYAAVVQR